MLIVLASVCFSTSGPLAKPIMDAGLSPQQVAGIRIGVAAVILLVVVALTRPQVLRIRRADLRIVLGYGLVAVAAVQVVYFIAVSRIPIGVAMLLEYTAPVLVALWVRFVRGTVLPRRVGAPLFNCTRRLKTAVALQKQLAALATAKPAYCVSISSH